MADSYRVEQDRVWQGEHEIPVIWSGDVAVAGAGPSGLGAAIAAQRAGQSTVLIEQQAYVGGMCSYGAGMPLGGAYPSGRTIGGIAEEILTLVREAGPDAADVRDMPHFGLWYFHDYEYFKGLAAEIVTNEGLEVRLSTIVVDAIMEGDRLQGLLIASKDGVQAVLAKAVVDCTGDADVAARAGAPFQVGSDDGGRLMAVTLPYYIFGVDVARAWAYRQQDPGFVQAQERADSDGLAVDPMDKWTSIHVGMRPNTVFSNAMRIPNVDGADVASLSRAQLLARRKLHEHITFLRRYVPGFEQAYIGHAGETLGIRDTRRILGERRLETQPCIVCEKPRDTILRCMGPLDNVSRSVQEGHGQVILLEDESDWYGIPYGTLVPQGIANLLVAGRCFSSSALAQAGSRGQALLIGMGEVAGTAAGLVAQRGMRAKDVDVPELQQMLTDQGCDLGLDELED